MVDEKIDAGISKTPCGGGGSSVGFVILCQSSYVHGLGETGIADGF
ncbi:MAG: hypothetical protein M3Q91_18360 [Acidobacteriota bacterium]|nr:hypothetical protein [Acidobacteriota bacterium]